MNADKELASKFSFNDGLKVGPELGFNVGVAAGLNVGPELGSKVGFSDRLKGAQS